MLRHTHQLMHGVRVFNALPGRHAHVALDAHDLGRGSVCVGVWFMCVGVWVIGTHMESASNP